MWPNIALTSSAGRNGACRDQAECFGILPCSTGVQQGDPLAPLLFSVGLHLVLEELLAIPELRQIWFLDDGILRGKAPAVRLAFAQLQEKLASIGLSINPSKCELYGCDRTTTMEGFESVPPIFNHDMWTYLGSPLCEETEFALETVLARVSNAAKSIGIMSATHPAQALQLLRVTAGACKVEVDLLRFFLGLPLVPVEFAGAPCHNGRLVSYVQGTIGNRSTRREVASRSGE